MPANKNGHYQPLPSCLTIRESPIAGLGLFARAHIPTGVVLGVTHVWTHERDGYWIRTPLGGFYNHNPKDPNCQSIQWNDMKFLYTLRDIQPDEELTARYTLYDPTK